MRRPRWLITVAVALATVGYVTWLVVADGDQIDRALLRFQGAALRWLVAAVVLEACSQLAASLMQRRLISAAGTDMALRHAVGLVLAQNAIGLSVPGGPVLATAYGFRQLRRRGTDPAAASWVIAASNVVTGLAVTVFVLFAVGGPDAWTIVTIAGFLLAIVVLVVAVERPARLRAPAVVVLHGVRRIRRRPTDDVGDVVDGVIARLSTVQLRRTDWGVLAVFAVASIATDCAALFCCVHAVTRLPPVCANPSLTARQAQRCARLKPPSTGTVLLAYAVGQGATTIPVVPGGIGLVETAMTATFTAGHLALIPALSVVLLYRLLSYWAVILVGGGCWFVLRRHRPAAG